MKNALRTMAIGLFVAFVGAGLTFGTAQAFSSTLGPSATVAEECGDDPWELGFCEDNGWNTFECEDACQEANFASGGCSPWEGTTKTCCICTA